MKTEIVNDYSLAYAKQVLGKKKFKKDKQAVKEIRCHFSAGYLLTKIKN